MKKILLITLLTFGLNIVRAQVSGTTGAPTKEHMVSVIINPVFALSATSNTNAYTFATAADLTNGITTPGAVNLNYTSNSTTKIMVSASAANFSGGSGGNPMPASVITVSNGALTTALSTTPFAIATGLAKGTGIVSIDYKIAPGLMYNPGDDYVISLIYTLTSN
jgi:hypothetical protein